MTGTGEQAATIVPIIANKAMARVLEPGMVRFPPFVLNGRTRLRFDEHYAPQNVSQISRTINIDVSWFIVLC